MRARGNECAGCTGFFRSVVTKKRRESAHARILEGILNGELRACVDPRRFFVTTDLKNPVCAYTDLQVGCHRKGRQFHACAFSAIQNQWDLTRMREIDDFFL